MKVYKKALVTGGAQRIGASMVEFLANNGIDVAIQYNRSEKEMNNIKKTFSSSQNHNFLYDRKLSTVHTNIKFWSHMSGKHTKMPGGTYIFRY